MILFINPPSRAGIYQGLGNSLAAIEPPLWARLLSSYCERKGIETAILDADAEGWDTWRTAEVATDADPILIVLVAHGQQPSASTQTMPSVIELSRAIKMVAPEIPVLIVGGHPAAMPEETLRETGADFVCTGEGPITVHELFQMVTTDSDWANGWGKVGGIFKRAYTYPAANVWNLTEEIPGGMWGKLPMDVYRAHNWHCLGEESRQPYASIYTSLGCPYSCLRGNTEINTIYGPIPIRDLADKYSSIPVYTYKNGEVAIADSYNIKKLGTNKKLVRVSFDDGSHIDCTPDHKFLTFKWGNGRAWSRKSIEIPLEAQNLKPGMYLRALRTEVDAFGRAVLTWARRKRRHRSRLVMDYLLGRTLTPKEQVHHKDHNRLNDSPRNLEYFPSASAHLRIHSEDTAARMKANNPAKNMTSEWREKIRIGITGLHRTPAQRKRYRQSKLGIKNPNFKDGNPAGRYRRINGRMKYYPPQVNHGVVDVTELPECADVYCLEVPGYGWFFAENVLVKNCSFCNIQNPFREGDFLKYGGKANSYRLWHPTHVVNEIQELVEKYGVRNLKIADEMFVLNRSHVMNICDDIVGRGLGDKLNIWCYARVDTVKDDRVMARMREAGIRWVCLGIESASEFVRDGVDKADYGREDILRACEKLRSHGINLIANFIVGLPDDTAESMRETVRMAHEIMPDFLNLYAAQTYPGSPLWDQAQKEGRELSYDWRTYAHHGYECVPAATRTLASVEVLRFRDEEFQKFYSSPSYQSHVLTRFGPKAVVEVAEMVRVPLKRKLLEENHV